VIEDFATEDKMDFKKIDANSVGGTANDAFTFIGTDAFAAHPGLAGAMRYFQDGGANRTYVEGDTNGDGTADFRLELVGLHTLTATGAGADILL
jgi:hypothetical protein